MHGWAAPTAVVRIGAGLSVAAAALAVLNARTAPSVRPESASSVDPSERITVCIPARDEAERLPHLLRDLLAQRTRASMHVLVLDDDSSDGTADVARAVVGGRPGFEIRRKVADGRTGSGKSLACMALGEMALARAESTAIVFLDADVRLHPLALDAALADLRTHGAALLSPWPGQIAVGAFERLVQPLLSWSWSVSLYVRGANRSTRPSMAVANGQFLVIDSAAYRAVGGHASTRTAVADDLTLARAVRRAGFRTVVAYGGAVATCRMYTDAAQVRAGHAKWLWSQFGGAAGTFAVTAATVAIWTVPPVAVVARGPLRWWGLAGYLGGAISRYASRRAEGAGDAISRDVVTAALHPISMAAGALILLSSDRGRRQGTLVWKSRTLRSGPAAEA